VTSSFDLGGAEGWTMRTHVGLAVLLLVMVAGCGGGSSSSTSSPQSSPAPPKGPASAQLTLAGDTGLAGPATLTQISCNFPTSNADGTLTMFLLAKPADPNVGFSITVSAGKIAVDVASGSGTAFRSRSFEGTGVTGFDAAKGVQIDTPLTETTAAGTDRGTVGAVTSVKGSVDCGNQTVGASTVTFTGDTADGAVRGGANPFRVECDTSPQGNFVTLVGIVTVGTTKAFFFTDFSPDSINIYETITGPPLVQHQYLVTATGVSTLSATGAHVTGDLIEQNPPTGTAHTVHVAGDVTCGGTVNR
jgi:hypothetical protein